MTKVLKLAALIPPSKAIAERFDETYMYNTQAKITNRKPKTLHVNKFCDFTQIRINHGKVVNMYLQVEVAEDLN